MAEPVLYESHMHTPLCRHAVGTPQEYAAVAHERGLKGIIVTCHNPLPDGISQDVRMYPDQWTEYLEIIELAREEWHGRIDVRVGLECDYLPGLEPWLEKQTSSASLHHVLGSVHPQIREYRRRYYTGDAVAYQRSYFEHLAQAAETGLFDTLAHPDLVKNIFPEKWQLERVMPDIERALDRIAASGVAMELNTSGLLKVIPEMNPGCAILEQMHARGIPVVIGADAHVPTRVAASYEEALDILEQVGYSHISFFLNRERQNIPIETARSSLRVGAS